MSAYSSKLNALFIHVPRTAGTSMEYALFYPTGGHETIRHWELDNEPPIFKFAFVRNPWDRFVSAYFCRDKAAGFEINVDGFNRYIEFLACKFPMQWPEFGVLKQHFRPMYFFLLNDMNEIGVDFIGRFENLQDDWQHVCNTLGVSVGLEHRRKFDHPRYDKCYTPENWDYIGQLYERDIQLFHYG